MKKYRYLIPVLALGLSTLSLGACDNKDEENSTTAAEQTTTDAVAPEETVTPAMEAPSPTPAAVTVLQAEGATAFATAADATTGAVFLTLHNSGASDDRLIAASTAKAGVVEIHEGFVDENGVMQMRKVDGISVPAGQMVQLKPGGYHIMLMQLNGPLSLGETFDVTLDFENGPDVTVPVSIVAPGDSGAMSHEGMDHSGHMMMDDSAAPVEDAPAADETPSPDAGADAPEQE